MASSSHFIDSPTRVRYVVLGLTTMVAVLLYLDRICLSFAALYVKEDLGISNEQMAVVLSAFFWAYALGQLPAGWLADRFGARLMLAVYVAVWSTFTGLLAFAHGLMILIVLRLGCGLFEAGGYPAAAGLIAKWIPLSRRGLASGIVSVGGRLGGAFAPVFTAYLIFASVPVSVSSLLSPEDVLDSGALLAVKPDGKDKAAAVKIALAHRLQERLRQTSSTEHADAALANAVNDLIRQPDLLEGIDISALDLPSEVSRLKDARTGPEVERRNRLVLEAAFPSAIRKIYGAGWRPAMLVYGIGGFVVAGVFWLFFRDSPRQHPKCNAAEIALIEGIGGQAEPKSAPGRLRFECLLTSVGLWLSSLVQLLTNLGWAFLITWLPRYLEEAHDVPLVERGWMASVPIFVGILGMLGGGWLTDTLSARLGARWGRSAPLALSRFLVMGAFIACALLHSPWAVTAALSIVGFGTDLGTPAVWAYSLDVGGKHVGSVLGWSNMFGNLGAALSPIVLNSLIGADKNYSYMFLGCAAVFALAGILALFLDASKPVFPPERLAS